MVGPLPVARWAWPLLVPVLVSGEAAASEESNLWRLRRRRHLRGREARGDCSEFQVGLWMMDREAAFDVLHVFSEYLWCLRQEATCEDFPQVCEGSTDCEAYTHMKTWSELLFSNSVLCPRSCGLCGPERSRAAESPLVADLRRGPCEPGWRYADGSCFFYEHVPFGDWQQRPRRTWPEAEGACRARGAHLATAETDLQNRAAHDLIRARPAYLVHNSDAWIGLRSEPAACNGSRGAWAWAGAGGGLAAARHFPCSFEDECPGPEAETAFVAMRSSLMGFGWVTHGPDFGLRGWVCSKPARFRDITSGRCEDYGLAPIRDVRACEIAAQVMLGVDAPAFSTSPGAFEGCTFSQWFLALTVPTASATERWNLSAFDRALCGPAPAVAAGGAEAPPQAAPALEGDVRATQEAAPLSPPLLVAMLIAAALISAVAVTRQLRRLLRVSGLHCPGLACARRWRRRRRGEGGGADEAAPLALAAVARLRRRRALFATGAAACLLALHGFELTRLATLAEGACKGQGGPAGVRDWLAAVHLASLCAAAAVLLLPPRRGAAGAGGVGAAADAAPDAVTGAGEGGGTEGGCRRGALRALLALLVALSLVETWLAGEQALLVESRLYRQIIWRLMLGACVAPPLALAGNVLYAVSQGILYWQMVPDGMVFVVGSGRAGLLLNQGCNQLFAPEEITKYIRVMELFQDMTVKSFGTEIPKGMQAILEMLLERKTDLGEFIMIEVHLVAITMAGLFLLNWLMSKDITQQLQLQNTNEQLSAMSRILNTFCDATVQISRDFRIAHRAPKLDRILHFAPTLTAMEGTDLRTVIASGEDRVAFEAEVQSKAQGERGGQPAPGQRRDISDSLYLNFKDGNESRVPVQVLVTMFKDAVGKPCFLCGINELGERPQPPCDGGGEGDATPELAARLRGQVADVLGRLGPEESSSSSRSSAGREGKGPRVPAADRRAQTAVRSIRSSHSSRKSSSSNGTVNDVTSKGYFVQFAPADCRVLQVTETFTKFLGMQQSLFTQLTQIMNRPEEFTNWLQQSMADIQQDTSRLPWDREVAFDITAVRVRQGRETRARYSLLCQVVFPKLPSGVDPLNPEDYAAALQVLQTSNVMCRDSL